MLSKASATDFDTQWTTPASGGGGLDPTLYNANTVLVADVDDTPRAQVLGASTLLGRGAAGSITALNAAAAKAVLAIVPADVSGLGALATKSTISDADVAPGAAIVLSKLAVDPLARANHTGTQLAATVSNFDTQVRTSRLDQMAAPITAVGLNGQLLSGVATPAVATDAATKGYVDGKASVGKYTTTIGDGVAVTYTVTHNLAMNNIIVELYETATGKTVYADITRTSVNAITVAFDAAPASAAIGVTVLG